VNPGDTVYYRDKTGAHFGHLKEVGRKWARVQHGERVKRVPADTVKPWPPARVEMLKRKVRRG